MKNNSSSEKGLNTRMRLNNLRSFDLRSFSTVIALVVIAIILQFITGGTFLTARNISNLLRSMSISGVIATGFVLTIISGNFDLAIGSNVALSGGIAALLHVRLGWNTTLVIPIAFVVGLVIGAFQGFWVAYKRIPSFIVTLGGMMAFRGIYLALTDGITITPLKGSFPLISSSYIPTKAGYVIAIVVSVILILRSIHVRFNNKRVGIRSEPLFLAIIKMALVLTLIFGAVFLLNSYNGIAYPVLILAPLFILFHFIATKTRFGRNVYAVGGNIEAARLSGINEKRTVFILYLVTGLLSAVSGILLTSRMNGATAVAGTGYEMDIISACVLGGASLSGGKGTVPGVLIGLLIISSLDNGMSLMNLSNAYQSIVKGFVLLLAVWFDAESQKRKA